MPIERVGVGRSRIEYTGDKLQIAIPTKKNWFLILFLGAWLGGWTFGEISALKGLFGDSPASGPPLVLFFWLIGWTVGGSLAVFVFLWNIAGNEIITLTQGLIQIERKVMGIGSTKQYSLTDSKGFRLSTATHDRGYWGPRRQLWEFGGGRISFDYGMKTVSFANGIDEAEANHLIDEMKRYNFVKA